MGFFSPSIETDDTAAPEPGDQTARRAGVAARRARTMRGRSSTILAGDAAQGGGESAGAPAPRTQTATNGGAAGRNVGGVAARRGGNIFTNLTLGVS